MLGFYPDIDGAVGSFPEVFHFVLEGREPPGLAGLGIHLLCLAIFIGEPEMPGRENDDHASHMRVQARLLMWSIVYVHHLYILILKSQPVVLGLNFGGILRERPGTEKQDCQRDAEEPAIDEFLHDSPRGPCLEAFANINPI